jgi:hypothetical protein
VERGELGGGGEADGVRETTYRLLQSVFYGNLQ